MGHEFDADEERRNYTFFCVLNLVVSLSIMGLTSVVGYSSQVKEVCQYNMVKNDAGSHQIPVFSMMTVVTWLTL